MATKASTIEFLTDQLSGVPGVSARKMFGEYCLYVAGKPVALVCDDQLFVKPTPAGATFAESQATMGHPYPGAKPHLLISADHWEDGDWLGTLIQTTARALPTPKPKQPPKAKPAQVKRRRP